MTSFYGEGDPGTNTEQGGSLVIGETPVEGGTPGDVLIVGPGGELEQQPAGAGGTPGAPTGSVQYNAGGGNFGGFTVIGDGTLNTLTGALSIVSTNGSTFGTLATAIVSPGTNGQVFLGSTSTNPAFQTLSGDGTVTNTGILTITKTNGVAFAASATTNALDASNINAGTLSTARLDVASSTTFGIVRVDGTSILSNSGIISASGSGAGNVVASAALTTNWPIIGAGGVNVSAVTAGINGQVFLGSTGAAPAFQIVGGDGNITNTGALLITSISGMPSKFIQAVCAGFGAI